MVIVSGQKQNALLHIFDEYEEGTWFNGQSGKNLNARDHWLTYRSHSKGKIIVDKGAKQALKEHKSLLPSGIIDVKGSFLSGQVVDIVDQDEQVIAKGIVQYSSLEIMLVKGHQSFEMKKILGNYDYDEIVHANNMVILGGKSNE